MIRDAVVIRINLDGKFKEVPFVQTGKSKGPSFLFPPGFIDSYLGGLSWYKLVSFWFFNTEMFYVVGDRFDGNDFDDVFLHIKSLFTDENNQPGKLFKIYHS